MAEADQRGAGIKPGGEIPQIFCCRHFLEGDTQLCRVDGARPGEPQHSKRRLAHTIQRSVPRARDLTGRTDFQRVAVLATKAALAIGNDTGPLHLAAAAGAPTVVLFSGASDPTLSAPRGKVETLRAERLAELPVAKVAQTALSLAPAPASA